MKKKQLPSEISVIIPARNENNGVAFLTSLFDDSIEILVNVYIVINASASDSEQIKQNNQALYNQLMLLNVEIPSRYKLHLILHNDLDDKESGVGLARKIGMDLAAKHHRANNQIGVMVCYDADCKAPKGYLRAIYNEFIQKQLELASIKYRHPVDSDDHPIVQYELFLRYYSEALRQSGYPFWFQTIGSSMAVLSNIYDKHGGMNKKKAGEDFYFMHKLMPVCKTDQINSTYNVLSARTSDRVPFGTGKAMNEAYNSKLKNFYSYQPVIFNELKEFFSFIEQLTDLNELEQCRLKLPNNKVVMHFNEYDYWKDLEKIKNNCKNTVQFKPRFYQFFNGFKVLKYVHWARDQYFTNIVLKEAVCQFLDIEFNKSNNLDLLLRFRSLEE